MELVRNIYEMKYVKLFEQYDEDHIDPTTAVYDEEEQAYRDPVSGRFVDPNTGDLFSEYVKKGSQVPDSCRSIWQEPKYPFEIPDFLRGCRTPNRITEAALAQGIQTLELYNIANMIHLKATSNIPLDQLKTAKKLYHSTTHKRAALIKANGFQLTKGTRNMGAHIMGGIIDYEVDNHGIFLSDNYRLAEFFGINRSGGGRNDADTLTVLANINNTLDLTSSENCQADAKPLVMATYHRLHGRKGKTIFKQSDIWSIVDDSDFITDVKQMGYDSVIFRESKAELKECGDMNALTYVVLDPMKLYIAPNNLSHYVYKEFLAHYINTSEIKKF